MGATVWPPSGDVSRSGVTVDGHLAVWDGTTATIKDGGAVPTGGSTWEVKTTNFTAVAGTSYAVDTSGGGVTVTMPASASAGDFIAFSDATFTWDTDNVTLGRNGLKINSGTSDYTANLIGSTITAVYVSAGVGWSVK